MTLGRQRLPTGIERTYDETNPSRNQGAATVIRHTARITTILLLVFLLLVPSPVAVACGPDFTAPTFTDYRWPDLHDSPYAQGRLGLLQSGYFHIYLYEAYRNLSGKPFTAAETGALRALALAALHDYPGLSALDSSQPQAAASQPKDWVAEWHNERARILGEKPKNQFRGFNPYVLRVERRDNLILEYPNCLSSAFENAVRVLQERAKKFGADSPALKDWISAQDQVFENCAGPGFRLESKPAVIPAAARAEDPAEIRADRAYQIAAAHFYAGEFDAAQSGFEQITKDPTSPYNKIAAYLQARVLIRKATLNGGDEGLDTATLSQAETQLRALLANTDYAEYHPAAQRLLGFTRIRLHRQQRLQELESALSAPGPSKTFGQDLADYLWLLDRPVLTKTVTVAPASAGQPAQKGTALDESSRLKGSDMTDWIFNFQEVGSDAADQAIKRWRETSSLPWLVSAISKIDSKNKALPDLLSAVSKVAPDSPAYVTLAFHRLRLVEQSGNIEAARRDLDQLLAQSKSSMPISARNEFLALRMKVAANLSEFLQFAPRISTDASGVAPVPAGQSDYPPGSPEYAATRPHFDSDAAVIFTEKLPLRLLADAAKSPSLPPTLRADVAIAAWTRAILLKNDAVAREVTPVLADLLPEAKAALAEYSSAPEGEQRDFTAVLEILRNPGFRPFVSASPGRGWFYSINEPRFGKLDELGDNWWCSFAPAKPNENWGRNYYRMFATPSRPLQLVYPGGNVNSPRFLTEQERTDSEREAAALAALPSPPRWLGQAAITWAKAHPDDTRVPEALHLVVSAWRYGCMETSVNPTEQEAGPNYSKEAFEFLHSRYPANEWTKKTPYWFK